MPEAGEAQPKHLVNRPLTDVITMSKWPERGRVGVG